MRLVFGQENARGGTAIHNLWCLGAFGRGHVWASARDAKCANGEAMYCGQDGVFAWRRTPG